MEKWVIVGLFLCIVISGCVDQIPEEVVTTTLPSTSLPKTTVKTTTTSTITFPTTTTISERNCRFLNFQIKSHLYRNEEFKFYFNNLGSEIIDAFDIHLVFDNKTSNINYRNQNINYDSLRVYEINVGPGLENATFVELHCNKSYFVRV
jgi:hypothetical protein